MVMPARKPPMARFFCPAPWFWAAKMAMVSHPLMPKAWTKFSIRVAAAKAEMGAAPTGSIPFTAPWIISLPRYRLDCCKAATAA